MKNFSEIQYVFKFKQQKIFLVYHSNQYLRISHKLLVLINISKFKLYCGKY